MSNPKLLVLLCCGEAASTERHIANAPVQVAFECTRWLEVVLGAQMVLWLEQEAPNRIPAPCLLVCHNNADACISDAREGDHDAGEEKEGG
jgi:hypothetical protein